MNGVGITGSLTYQNYTQFFNAASDLDTTTASASVEMSYPITEYQSVILGATLQQADLITTSFSNEQSRQWVQANGKPYEREVVNPVTGAARYVYFGFQVRQPGVC